MAPTFYHRAPMHDLEELGKEPQKLWRWKCLALGSLGFLLATLIPLIYFMAQALSPACREGLRVQQRCLNDTQSLQQSLESTQRGLDEARAQLANYSLKVVSPNTVGSGGGCVAPRPPHLSRSGCG